MSDRFISFRLSESAYEKIEEIARVAGKKPNEWCRELVESEAGVGSPLSGTERILYEEIACLRYLVGSGLGLLSTGTLTVEKWNEKVKEAESNAASIVRSLLEKRRARPRI